MPKGSFGFERPFGIGPFVTEETEIIGIWALEEYDEVRDLIIETAENCRRTSEYDNDIVIVVFGSYGRGNAEVGKSDLDLDIMTVGDPGGMAGLTLKDNTIEMYNCIRNVAESEISDVSNGKIKDVEIREDALQEPDFFLAPALKTEEPNIGYDLIGEEIIEIEDVEERNFETL